MDNHWHIVFYTPIHKDKHDLTTIIEQDNEYYQGKNYFKY